MRTRCTPGRPICVEAGALRVEIGAEEEAATAAAALEGRLVLRAGIEEVAAAATGHGTVILGDRLHFLLWAAARVSPHPVRSASAAKSVEEGEEENERG
jgi:hypothetical protein